MNAILSLARALSQFIFPPTTPTDATVVAKFYDRIFDPSARRLSDSISMDYDLNTIEVPTLKISIDGAAGTPSIQVPTTLYNKVEVGGHVEVRTRPSRFFANTTRVSFAF